MAGGMPYRIKRRAFLSALGGAVGPIRSRSFPTKFS